jgi:hypothetical protein
MGTSPSPPPRTIVPVGRTLVDFAVNAPSTSADVSPSFDDDAALMGGSAIARVIEPVLFCASDAVDRAFAAARRVRACARGRTGVHPGRVVAGLTLWRRARIAAVTPGAAGACVDVACMPLLRRTRAR